MGVAVFILGPSGSGKSTSLRNFEKEELAVFNVAGKPLPFRKRLNVINNATYSQIQQSLAKANFSTYVIDDSQYLLAFDLFNRAEEKTYDKFTAMAVSFQRLIRFIQTQTPDDCIVYFMHHTEMGQDGIIKAKTIGKMLDEKLSLEGLSSIVLLTKANDKGHFFITQGQGVSVAKSPMEMFTDLEIANDLKSVDDTIRDYYGLPERKLYNPTKEAA